MKKIILAALFAVAGLQANAGGLLTNTNQSINFLRNPARDGAIAIDGVYYNPAGVAFLNEGFHLGLNWQAAWQTREITTQHPLLMLGVKNNKNFVKDFKGEASAPVIPSVQAAYNTGKWSFQFNFAIHGGGGKCTFDNGLGSFESQIGGIAASLANFGAKGYDMGSFLEGKQYYFGFTVGAAYKINDNLSVYGGLRTLYGSASYKASINPINVYTANGLETFDSFYHGNITQYLTSQQTTIQDLSQAVAGGVATEAQVKAYEKLMLLRGLGQYANVDEGYVNLQSDQYGVGFQPIIGVDYKIGNFNFAAKYEFRARMSLKNESSLTKAGVLDALKKFEDGTSIREDNPASLSLGAQWTAMPNLRVNAGYHHFYDCESKKYGDAQKALDGGTNEYLAGVEYDVTDKLTVSGGAQVTRYGLTDKFMNDMSFVCNSWSFGLGAAYKVSDKVKVEVAYFQTNYDKYTTAGTVVSEDIPIMAKDTFYRTNRVLGAGVTFDF